MSQTLKYSLRVWLSVWALAPLLLVAILLLTDRNAIENDFFQPGEVMVIAWVVGCLFSIPSWLLFFIVANYIVRTGMQGGKAKWLLSALTIVCCVLSIAVVFRDIRFLFDQGRWQIVVSYSVVIIASVWFYRLSPPASQEIETE